ncbi:Calreticulin-domain-containing protein [Yamadazyma tenuis ATCC 10573]|uniref:Calreticulin-domain-containing protein n=2 Tax=Candida tenuis TaxID=2315449 RepID=G3B4F4_CANTC|nr:Calreticulin-domain-containing protein [Yamadazyma tenuis ATCC 10573]EGV63811.1 Calreticulin-domain-containing protein [Yamadazyma tenuis ATCC 10573]
MAMRGVLIISALFLGVSSVEHPSFVPFDTSQLAESSLFEQFLYGSLKDSNWQVSKAKKDDKFSYSGEWAIEPASKYPGISGDSGLVLKTKAAHHAISYKLDTPFDNTDNDLVLQYEIKTQDGLECGGTYIKLLNKDFDQSGPFSSQTPFQLMFGPDKCGSNDKIHFIINRKNPITNTYEEKHLSQAPMSRSTQVSTLYTLIFKRNSDFEIRINGQVVKAGNVLSKPHLLKPKLNPPKEIEDATMKKPDDWEDEEFIFDESVQKPEDYDEKYASAFIPDPEDTKPEGWLDDEPSYIVDASVKKPEEWIDEEDGEWMPPALRNPKCTVGCGEWKPKLISNKNYKGPWTPSFIPNPRYKGQWRPSKVPNPYYYEDHHPSNLGLIGGLGFELWSMEKDILFDNIYLGHSVQEAELIGNKTFIPKLEIEQLDYAQNRPKAVKGPSPPPKSFEEMLRDEENTLGVKQILIFFYLIFKREFLSMSDFYYQFRKDPANTLFDYPLKAAVYSGVILFGFTFFFGTVNAVVFYLSRWSDATKESINMAREAVDRDYGSSDSEGSDEESEDDSNSEGVPKIFEISAEGDEFEIKATSTERRQTEAVKRS